jgi:hypothetical protein
MKEILPGIFLKAEGDSTSLPDDAIYCFLCRPEEDSEPVAPYTEQMRAQTRLLNYLDELRARGIDPGSL